jgi:Domain of unknown function (DUF4443)
LELQSVRELLRMAVKPSLGPSPSFESAHLIFAFITIGENGIIGRQTLAARSGLKEGPIRTILKKLREEGYAEANASGCFLSRAGRRVYVSLGTKLSPIILLEGSKLTMGGFQAALAVRAGARAVRSGLEQRDSAIRLRAAGATTYVIKEGKFTIPGGSSDCEKDFPSHSWSLLRNHLRPVNNDAVIVSGAEDETTAKLGALSAALTLL